MAFFDASLPCLNLSFLSLTLTITYLIPPDPTIIYHLPLLLARARTKKSTIPCPLSARATLPHIVSTCPSRWNVPSHSHHTQALEVAVAGPDTTISPTFNVISPTPRAFTFPMNVHAPSRTPSISPFEPDLRQLSFTTPPPSNKTHTPSSSISSLASLSLDTNTLSADGPISPSSSHRRRRSTVSDINERRPKKGDEDYIKRPENAFILFRRKCCEDRNLAQGAGDAGEVDGSTQPTKKQRQADLSKTISQQWKSLSAEERQFWEDLAKEKKVSSLFQIFSLSFY